MHCFLELRKAYFLWLLLATPPTFKFLDTDPEAFLNSVKNTELSQEAKQSKVEFELAISPELDRVCSATWVDHFTLTVDPHISLVTSPV